MNRRIVRLIVSALSAGLAAWLGALVTGTNGQVLVPSKWQLIFATVTGVAAGLKDIQAMLSEPPG